MIKTPKSAAEIEILSFWKQLSTKITFTIEEFHEMETKLNRLMISCEKLRKSRDNWRAKYENLNKNEML